MSINYCFKLIQLRCWTTQIIDSDHYTFLGVIKKNKIKQEIYIHKVQTNKQTKPRNYIPKSKSFSCRDASFLSILSCLSISWWILALSLSSPDMQQSPILNSLNLLQYFSVNTFISPLNSVKRTVFKKVCRTTPTSGAAWCIVIYRWNFFLIQWMGMGGVT